MRRLLLVLLALSLVGYAEPVKVRRNLTDDFVRADLVYVLEVLAGAMGRKLYVGPSVQGQVDVSFRGTHPEEALRQLLREFPDLGYELHEGPAPAIVVGSRAKLLEISDYTPHHAGAVAPERSIRLEFLLEEATSARVMDILVGEYDQVEFALHPTMNGFYATGSREDLISIKQELRTLDKASELPPAPFREFLPVKQADLEEACALVSALVPDVHITLERRMRLLIVEGPPESRDRVRELLRELDPEPEPTWFLK